MGNKIIKVASWMLSSFFLLVLVLQLFNMVFIDLHLMQIMVVSFALGGVCCIKKKGLRGFDILVIVYFIYMLLNGLAIDYQHHWEFLYRAMLSHVFPVMCYFIARYTQNDVEQYLDKMKWPILFAMVCGIAFYYIHPSWYVVMKEAQIIENASDMSIGEAYRLSSFWGHPYVVGYATLLYSIYVTDKLVRGIPIKRERYFYLLVAFICLVVLLLAQLRVTIVIYALSVIYMMLFSRKESLTKKMQKVLMLVFCVVLFAFVFQHIASDSMDYISYHMQDLTEDDSMSERFEHTAGGVTSYSLFGDGLGRYGYPARNYGKWAIVDQEFQCHVAELGYFGVSLLLGIIFFTVIRCLKRLSLVVENSILFFFFIAMLGASVLSNGHQYNYIFWYTLGLVWSANYKRQGVIINKRAE